MRKTNKNKKIYTWLHPDGHWHVWVNTAAILCYTCRECGQTWTSGWDPNPMYDRDPAACLDLIEAVRAKGYAVQLCADSVVWKVEVCNAFTRVAGQTFNGSGDTLLAATSAAVLKLIKQEEG